MGYQASCEKLLNNVFTRPQSSFFSFGTTNMGYCSYDEQRKKNVSRMIMEWKCNKTSQVQKSEVNWDSVLDYGHLISISIHG